MFLHAPDTFTIPPETRNGKSEQFLVELLLMNKPPSCPVMQEVPHACPDPVNTYEASEEVLPL
ncbi:MAG: hypothetical protein ACKN92_07285 [Candidatus Nanopelagicaceae bacterium]